MSFDKGRYSMMGLPSRQVAQRDLTSHSRLKLRRVRGGDEETAEEKLKRLKAELEERETKLLANGSSTAATTASSSSMGSSKESEPKNPSEVKSSAFDDEDADAVAPASSEDDGDESEQEQPKVIKPNATEVALQKELERVKMERKLKEEQSAIAKLTTTNPLLEKNNPLQRRWDDDVIFRNQSKGEPDRREKRLVNDIVHSDTHKDFLKKHIL